MEIKLLESIIIIHIRFSALYRGTELNNLLQCTVKFSAKANLNVNSICKFVR